MNVLLRFFYALVGGVFLLAPVTAYGQHDVSGTVVDSTTGATLPGVNIVVQETNQGTTTSSDGTYELTAPSSEATLVFSFVGYETMEVPIRGRDQIDVALSPQTVQSEELVIVGYGEQEQGNIASSVSEVEGEELETVGVANNTDKLAGRVPGLVTRQTTGQPGADARTLNIRGFGDPLVLVDGVEMSMSQVDPSSIESISVLKDASAAMYGMRAGNGVILVETKRGSEGQFEEQIGGQIDRDALLNQQWTQEELFGNRDARFRGVFGYPESTFRDTKLYFHTATRVDGQMQESDDYPVPLDGVDTDWPKSGHPGDTDATGIIGLKNTSPNPANVGRTADDTDWMEFRLGEMYLNAAEAAYHLGREGEARDLINTLRARAGMPSVSYSGTQLRDLIRNERRVELALEHQLYWDLRRWRIAHDELDGTRFKGVNLIYDWNDKAYEVSEFINAWGQSFTFAKRQYYHPIGTERLADTGLEENPGY